MPSTQEVYERKFNSYKVQHSGYLQSTINSVSYGLGPPRLGHQSKVALDKEYRIKSVKSGI